MPLLVRWFHLKGDSPARQGFSPTLSRFLIEAQRHIYGMLFLIERLAHTGIPVGQYRDLFVLPVQKLFRIAGVIGIAAVQSPIVFQTRSHTRVEATDVQVSHGVDFALLDAQPV